MLQTLKNAFKIKDVRRRIYYVLLMLVIVRIGSQLPIPGVDSDYFKNGLRASPVMHSIFLMHSLEVLLPRCPYLH